MKVALDTSVLVAALVRAHPLHGRALPWVSPKGSLTRTAHWHAYAESWAVLTAMPLEPRVSSAVATTVLEQCRKAVDFQVARRTTYPKAARRCRDRGLSSGAIYDALHLVAAEEASVEAFVTFNQRDFDRLAIDDSPRIVVPPDPPRVSL